MAKDILGNIELTVSDVRESIIVNLERRFKTAGIDHYDDFVSDLSHPNSEVVSQKLQRSSFRHPARDITLRDMRSPFDLIIADLPCTGSGTWSRTPEQLYFFNPSSIKNYSDLQKKIISNVIPHLKKTGKLLYITCSVFQLENEGVVRYALEQFPLKLEKMKILNGYDTGADTMFAALLSYL
jgi:16S rRNA (cytosine967-C5)-methyltransferase